MKLNIWIEIQPWNVNHTTGELLNAPYPSTSPFAFPCSSDIQRFKVEVDIPYKIEELPTVKADVEPIL